MNIYARYQTGSDLLRVHFYRAITTDDFTVTEEHLGCIDLTRTQAAAVELNLKYLKFYGNRTDVLDYVTSIVHEGWFTFRSVKESIHKGRGRPTEAAPGG